MNPDRWARIKDVFHAALDRPADERSVFLDAACGADDELRADVARLLVAHERAGNFIEQSPVALLTTVADVVPSLVGRAIGHYEIDSLIGAGGMGAVYAARDTVLGRQVAVKVVTRAGSDAEARLRQEAHHASQLNHPNICTIHEVGTFDGQPFIVMEYVKGQALSELISQHLPLESALAYAVQIADALAHAHRHGIVHRDLTSANILVTPEGRAKILDFGLAHGLSPQQAREISQPHTAAAVRSVPGTLPYLAPELLRGEPADTASDIWALGTVLYEMVCGRRPFTGNTTFELTAAIVHAQPEPLPGWIPASLQDIVRRCLAKDRRHRYAQANEIRSAIEAVQAEIASGTSRGASRRTMAFPLRRAAAVAALVTLIAFGGAFLFTRFRATPSATAVAPSSGRPAVAVMVFDNLTGADDMRWLTRGLPNMLLTGLAQTRGLEIVSAQRVQEALKRSGNGELESLDKATLAAVAREAGAGAVVVGSFVKSGPELRIDAQLEDLATGRVVLAETVRGTDVFTLADQLATRIRDGMGFGNAADIRPITDVSSRSLEAYRLYSQGVEAYDNVRMDDARSLLDQAVAIDPAFADAYLHLALVSYFTGRFGGWRDYLHKANEHADRLSERQRLLLEVESARQEGNGDVAGRRVDDLLAKFPDSDDGYTVASWLYGPMGLASSRDKLLTTVAKGVAALPSSVMVRNIYGYALLDTGQYERALRELNALVRVTAREPNTYDSLGEAHLLMGAPEKSIEYYARALTVDPRFVQSHVGRAWALAALGRYDEALAENPPDAVVNAFILSRVGRYADAERAMTVGQRRAVMDQNAEAAAAFSLLRALVALERRQSSIARHEIGSAEQLLAQVPGQAGRTYLVLADVLAGMADLAGGEPAAARVRLMALRNRYRPELRAEKWWEKALEGDIALADKRPVDAARLYLAGEPAGRMWANMTITAASVFANGLPSRDGTARALEAQGNLRGAIDAYRRLTTPGTGQKWVAMLEPRYVLEMARLLERTGDATASRTEYQRFLDLWQHADPGLMETAEARAAVTRLAEAR